MTMQTWLLFCITETVLCFIPGPAVLFVLSTALRRGLAPASIAAAGILAGNTFYFALSATGIAAVMVASHAVFGALKWAGAAYLVWLGLRMLLARASVPAAAPQRPDARADAGGGAGATAGAGRVFSRAFIVQAANPKALVFFVALLPQFINPAGSVPWQILLLGISSVVIEFAVLSLYAAVAARARSMSGARFANWLERIGGACLIAAGARMAWYRIV
jgi:threonine/homoserine/homoserine lactone efflux protein